MKEVNFIAIDVNKNMNSKLQLKTTKFYRVLAVKNIFAICHIYHTVNLSNQPLNYSHHSILISKPSMHECLDSTVKDMHLIRMI